MSRCARGRFLGPPISRGRSRPQRLEPAIRRWRAKSRWPLVRQAQRGKSSPQPQAALQPQARGTRGALRALSQVTGGTLLDLRASNDDAPVRAVGGEAGGKEVAARARCLACLASRLPLACHPCPLSSPAQPVATPQPHRRASTIEIVGTPGRTFASGNMRFCHHPHDQINHDEWQTGKARLSRGYLRLSLLLRLLPARIAPTRCNRDVAGLARRTGHYTEGGNTGSRSNVGHARPARVPGGRMTSMRLAASAG